VNRLMALLQALTKLGARIFTSWFLAVALILGGGGLYWLAETVGSFRGLQALAAGVVGAGLAILSSKSTGKEAVSQEYHKAANLQRKAEFYAPLHADLKFILDRLTQVRDGKRGFVQKVGMDRHVGMDPTANMLLADTSEGGALSRWVDIRSDSRVENFSEKAREILDDAATKAIAYNEAFTAIQPVLHEILAKHFTQAIYETRQHKDFKDWQQKCLDAGGVLPGGVMDWYTLFDLKDSDSELGAKYSSWLLSLPTSGTTALPGWLLANKTREATATIAIEQRNGIRPLGPPKAWLEPQLERALQDLKRVNTYQLARKTEAELFETVSKAEQHLAKGLRTIRDRYEGGEPLV